MDKHKENIIFAVFFSIILTSVVWIGVSIYLITQEDNKAENIANTYCVNEGYGLFGEYNSYFMCYNDTSYMRVDIIVKKQYTPQEIKQLQELS